MKKTRNARFVALFMSLSGVVGACTMAESTEDFEEEEVGTVEQPLDLETGGEDPGGAGGGCSVDCHCPLGQHCYGDGTCRGTVVFGPAPPLLPCVDSCQCSYGSHCDMWAGSYGYCQ